MTKKIAIATLGTLGDVQPYVALGVALKRQGYDVVLGATEEFHEFITSYGIEHCDLGPSVRDFLLEPKFDDLMSQMALVNMAGLLRDGQNIVETAARRAWQMCRGVDALIININTSFGIDIGEALDLPVIMTALQPLNMTAEHPMCTHQARTYGPTLNRLTYSMQTLQQAYFNFPRNRLRRELMGLTALRKGGFSRDPDGQHLTTLYAYSEQVSSRPRDWPKSAIITGFWPLEDQTGWQPSPEFRAFLAAGEAPIYVGFGSMPFGAERNTAMLKDAVKAWGGRVVVGRGWGGINPDDLPPEIFPIEKAPHDKLFKYVRAVVHHGGAGTTSAGLYNGKPSFIVPQTHDQPYWGRRVYELGCGPKPVRLRRLTPELLAGALTDLSTNGSYTIAAEALASRLNAENGVDRAIKIIERVLNNFVPGGKIRPRRPFRARASKVMEKMMPAAAATRMRTRTVRPRAE